jgi:hypothetical protein
MSSAQLRKDKTHLFQALESEVKASGSKTGKVDGVLQDAEFVLTPFFENGAILRKMLGAGALTYEGSFLLHKSSEPWVAECVWTLLKDFRAARTSNPTVCFETWANWMESTDRAIANVAATAQLQRNKAGLEPNLFVKSCLRDMADILEGSLQIFARLRLKIIEAGGSRNKTHKSVEELSFGEVIEELVDIGSNEHIYEPPPFGVTVSQWRNIANHNGYDTKGDEVTCTYGQPGKRKSFKCTADDILAIARYANDLCFAHKVAIEIFGIDNFTQLRSKAPEIPLSDFTKDSCLAFGLVSSGFSIREVINDNGIWNLILFDERGRNKVRAKLALQEACFSYALMCGGCHIEASVRSFNVTHQFGFKTSFTNREQKLPADFRGSIRPVSEDFRLGPDERT